MNDISFKTNNKLKVIECIQEWHRDDKRDDRIQVYDHDEDLIIYSAFVFLYRDGGKEIMEEVNEMSYKNVNIENLTWHELQEFNELRPNMKMHEDFKSKYIRLKKKYELTDNQMKQVINKATRLMPRPDVWV